jgi:hypothetical protein
MKWKIVKMSELEIALRNEIEELRNEIEELRYMFKAFAEPCAIGSEQLWKVVFNDILKQPVPNGVDLRELV